MIKRLSQFLNSHKKTRIFLKFLQWVFTIAGILSFLLVFWTIRNASPENKKDSFKTTHIQFINEGTVDANSSITVMFNRPLVGVDRVGTVEDTSYLSVFSGFLSSAVKGTLTWSRRNTLTFVPDQPLKAGKVYTIRLAPKKLFPKETVPSKYDQKINVQGQVLEKIRYAWEPVSDTDGQHVRIQGTLQFRTPVPLALLRESLQFKKGRTDMPLKIQSTNSDFTEFTFESEPVDRKANKGTFTLSLTKSQLNLENHFSDQIPLISTQDFQAVRISHQKSQSQARIQIEFSDPLKPNQDVTGLVTVEGLQKKDYQVKIIGNALHIIGNFKTDKAFKITLSPGVLSQWDIAMKTKKEFTISLEHENPQVRFFHDGYVLPSTNKGTLMFETVNLKRVRVDVYKVDESNLSSLRQYDQFSSQKNRHLEFYSYFMHHNSVPLVSRSLDILPEGNSWHQHAINMADLFRVEDKGIYIVSLSFTYSDMIFSSTKQSRSSNYSIEYFKKAAVHKLLIRSDIGLTVKESPTHYHIYSTHLETGQPLPNIQLHFLDQNYDSLHKKDLAKLFFRTQTDRNGVVSVPKSQLIQKKFLIKSIWNDQFNFIMLDSASKWNQSTFDTGGIDPVSGAQAFMYTDRGVYRPGSTIHLSVIARENGKPVPDRLPARLKMYNPKNQLIYDIQNTDSYDGFYTFTIPTKEDDLTGNWSARLDLASRTFNTNIKVETIVPYKLKVTTKTEPEAISMTNKSATLNVNSTYLMGNPAKNHPLTVSLRLDNLNKSFKSYPGYSFSNMAHTLTPTEQQLFSGELDDNGQQKIPFTLNPHTAPPSAVQAQLISTVLEKGGRPVRHVNTFVYDPYSRYVGIEQLDTQSKNYLPVNEPLKFQTILLDLNGDPIPDKTVHYSIYKNQKYWWWEFQSNSNHQLSYKRDEATELVKRGTLTTGIRPESISFTPESRGVYMLEVRDSGQNAHASSQFFSVGWGSLARSGEDAASIRLRSEKLAYTVGDTATIYFPAPPGAQALITLEKGATILSTHRTSISDHASEGTFSFQVTPAMLPNVYVSVSVIQPHLQTKNDLPIRMYGIMPITVQDPHNRDNILVDTPKEIQPNQEFEVKIQSQYKEKSQFTIAVVDEGLLDITGFTTPDPLALFTAKQRLNISTYDNFSSVIGANKGDIFKTFSIGGADALVRQEIASKLQRFKPVALFKGPIWTDQNGFASVKFNMPQYVGSVRVMVIGAKGNRYSRYESAVPVRAPLMLISSAPRTLKLNDQFEMTVSLFSNQKGAHEVTLNVQTAGPVLVKGDSQFRVQMSDAGETVLKIPMIVKNEMGAAQIMLTAYSGVHKSQSDINISVGSPTSHISKLYKQFEKNVDSGIFEWELPKSDVPGSDIAFVTISKLPQFYIGHRLDWLVRYPYGCIEQTTSAVLPQLFLKEIFAQQKGKQARIDQNINAGIERLKLFQTQSGGFSYWPGEHSNSEWGTNYAGHFLLAAKEKGYQVPDSLLNNWLKFQHDNAYSGSRLTRIYRLYLLALSGNSHIGAMNDLLLNQWKDVRNTEKWLMAAAYALAGQADDAKQIYSTASFDVDDYQELGGTYGSRLRDQAIILNALLDLKIHSELIDSLLKNITDQLSNNVWYSTQALGYSLLSVGRYVTVYENNDGHQLSGDIHIGSTHQSFRSDRPIVTIPLLSGFGETLKVNLNQKKLTYIQVNWEGAASIKNITSLDEKIRVTRQWFNEDGERINIQTLKQGDKIWGLFRVEKKNEIAKQSLEELVLDQIIPSGWEIDNMRLSKDLLPTWMSKYTVGKEDYYDIQDDRVSWFFDMNQSTPHLDFVLKISVVSPGEFILAPTLAEAMYDRSYRSIIEAENVSVSK
jgi:uncharacterized protein YfaS (alpha-2-macroglobulin family)